MERSLVGTEVHPYAFVGQTFPEVYHVAHVGHGDDLFAIYCHAYAGNELVELIMEFVHPALVVAFARRQRIDFRGH